MQEGSPAAKDEEKDTWVPRGLRPKFGQVCDFWKRYDELADRNDKEMSQTLNTNLDVLLIFAALFSAINTTFISLTMPSLSPDPMDKTNMLLELLVRNVDNATLSTIDLSPPFSPESRCVTTNCLLYASLCCSLLAAMGAMLAKEWLQNFNRTGQVGPLEKQARTRQRKFYALKRWHFEEIVLFLPNLLIMSVLLFFAGLALFVFPINQVVGGIVIAFICVNAIFVCTTAVAGAIHPFCPYQTALSRALRSVLQFFGFARRAWRQWQKHCSNENGKVAAILSSAFRFPAMLRALLTRVAQPIVERLRPWTSQLYANFHFGLDHGKEELTADDEEQLWDARAACWLLEITSKFEDQLVIARGIFTLDRAACNLVAQHPFVWKCLLVLTVDALRSWRDQPTPRNRYVAEQFGAALCHLLLAYPRTDDRWREVAAQIPSSACQSGGGRLCALDFAIHGYWHINSLDIEGTRQSLAQTDYCLAVVVLRCLINNDEYPASDYVSCLIKRPHDDAILALLATIVMKPLSPPSNRGRRPPERDTVKLQDEELVWDALTGRNIEQTLAKALVARATYIFYREEELRPRTRPEDRSRDLKLRADQAEVFTAIMRRTKEIISRDNTERSFLEHWGESFEAFVVQVNPVPAVVDDEAKEALFCFAVEVLSTSKILFGTLESGWNSQVIEGYWRLLDWGILTQPNSQKDRDLARNRIYEVVMWMFGKGQTHGDPSWLSNHPGIIAYITMGLKDDRVSGSRWLKPIRAILKTFLPEKPFKHRGHSGDILEFLFKMDLAQGIIVCLSRSRDLDDWITATEIMQYCIEASSQFAQQLLNDGFLEILANMILDDNSVLRGHHAHFDYQSRVTGVISQLCAHSLAKAAWSTDSMLLALRRVFTPADWEPTRLMLDVSNQTSAAPFGSSSLVQLAEEVKEHRPAPFFISRNIDVAFNRFCGHRGRQIDWSYCLYEEPETGAACPSIVFAEYELL